jgi:NAD(P)-dependent dehydrogenase (short-subunit alcohol dehydrogenase family)
MAAMLHGKVILVTGAGGGIGSAACAVLSDHGARLVVSDIDASSGERTAESVRETGGEAIFLPADLASEAAIEQLIDDAASHYGRLDGAFNNAGIEQSNVPLTELRLEQWERALRIDLTAVFLCIKYQVQAMLRSGGGSIVNTASGLGQIAIPNAAEYVAAKHGVIGLTRAAAVELGGKKIRVNSILPGIVETDLISRLSVQPEFKAFLERSKERHLLGRFAAPREIGEAVAWLLSDQSSFVNGTAMPVDGGYLSN